MFVGRQKNNSQKRFCSLFWCHIIPNRTFFSLRTKSLFGSLQNYFFLLLLLLFSFSIHSLRICSRPLTFRCSYFSFVQFIIELMLWALAFISGFFCCCVSYSICFAPVSQVFIGTVSGMCLMLNKRLNVLCGTIELQLWKDFHACWSISRNKCIQTWILYFILKE